MDVAQAGPFMSAAAYDFGPEAYEELPNTQEPVNILGTSYSAIHEKEDIKHDVLSRLWFTYRRGFSPIGGDGPTSDVGWGCMLRCGQMMLAQALVILHLGREWRWYRGKNHPSYYEILKLFLDNKTAPYSIHQITNMGVSEGKPVGEWLGPNTIAQVLKKLAFFDNWSNLAIHIALDNTIVKEDLVMLGRHGGIGTEQPSPQILNPTAPQTMEFQSNEEVHDVLGFSSDGFLLRNDPQKDAKESEVGTSHSEADAKDVRIPLSIQPEPATESAGDGDKTNSAAGPQPWHPILLVIPLRLGLSDINPVYFNAIKKCFALRQCVGIIGGKPNQAHWFVGSVGDDLIYLDPHTNQPYEDFNESRFTDETFHCSFICRMPLDRVDPSMAIGFLCSSEDDLNDCLQSIRKFILHDEKSPMFEIYDQRPPHWPSFKLYTPDAASFSDYETVDRQYDTDEEFELL